MARGGTPGGGATAGSVDGGSVDGHRARGGVGPAATGAESDPTEPSAAAPEAGLLERTFVRFVLVGLVNTLLFYALFEAGLRVLGSEDDARATVAWVNAWILGSLFAHFTHRQLTFRSSVRLRRSVPMTFAVYALAMTGSTLTYAATVDELGLGARMAWVLNTALWGVLDYLALRHAAFPRPGPASRREAKVDVDP